MRGTYDNLIPILNPARFIPAHAGNIGWIRESYGCAAVHPRACGEHGGIASAETFGAGSSPRMRGTYTASALWRYAGRFIPAHAGNIVPDTVNSTITTVHPRACGEHLMCRGQSWAMRGSSPRMRGTCLIQPSPRGIGRFIPAHAGNISVRLFLYHRPTVHPRACGEHRPFPSIATCCDGSSPRMRGT